MTSSETKLTRGKNFAARVAFGLLLAPLLLISLAAPSARAQARQDARPDESQETLPQPQRPRRDGANLLMRLNLTPEQLTQLREIRRESEQQARAFTRRVNVARRALDEAIYADQTNETLVEERVRELSQAQAALVRLRAQTELRVRRVLTAEQLQSFRDLRQRARLRQRAQRRLNRRGRQQQQLGPAPRPEGSTGTTPPPRPSPPPARRRP